MAPQQEDLAGKQLPDVVLVYLLFLQHLWSTVQDDFSPVHHTV